MSWSSLAMRVRSYRTDSSASDFAFGFELPGPLGELSG